MMRYLVLTGAVLTGVVAVWMVEWQSSPEPSPLSGFQAPFVYGRFHIPQDNPLTQEGVELGRHLFYDPLLSGNNQVSCATCHIQQLGFADGKARAVGVSGKPLAFNSMALANLLWGPQHFFWDGRAGSLEEHALQPIINVDEMDQPLHALLEELRAIPRYVQMFDAAYGEISEINIARALASFQRTLVSDDSRYDRYLRGEESLSDIEEHGRKLFMAHPDVKVSLRGGNCIDCHSQFLTAGFSTYYDGFANNGLDPDEKLPEGLASVTGDPGHRGFFKVPSLRNIALTAPYMHDGRFQTLEEVLDHYNEGIVYSRTLSPLIAEASNSLTGSAEGVAHDRISLHLSDEEKQAIIAFLHTLTDDRFTTNPRFSNPFPDGVPDV